MLLPASFSFFSELLEKDNFLNVFNKFSNNKFHSTPDLYICNKPIHNHIVINTKSECYLYNNTKTPNFGLQSNKRKQVQVITIVFLGFDEDGYPLFKWHDVNENHSLIYSRFIHQGIQHYYVFSYIDNTVHFDINDSYIMKKWHARSKYYRDFILYQHNKNLNIGFETII